MDFRRNLFISQSQKWKMWMSRPFQTDTGLETHLNSSFFAARALLLNSLLAVWSLLFLQSLLPSKLTLSFVLVGREFGSTGHIQTHQAKGLSLLGKGFIDLRVWLLDHCTQCALEELGLGVCPPGGWNWAVASAHGGLKPLVFNFFGEERCENDLNAFVNKVDVREAELEREVVVEFYHVLDGEEYWLQSIFNNVLSHLAGCGDRNWVGVDHAEALLEDGSLGFGRGNPFFTIVANAVILKFFVNNENGSKLLQLQILTSSDECAYAQLSVIQCRCWGWFLCEK